MEKGKIILWVIIAILVAVLVLSSLGFKITKNNNILGGSGSMPEKCQKPEGQDVASWKEHLGHHAETQECLKYYQ